MAEAVTDAQVTTPFTSVLRALAAPTQFLALPINASSVVVAFVVVALTPVKFCSVVEPVCSVLLKVERPAVAVKVPVKLAEEEMFCPLMSPEVTSPVFKAVE